MTPLGAGRPPRGLAVGERRAYNGLVDWFSVFVCPICHGELTFDTAAVCAGCARSYPIESGVPVLLPARPPGAQHPEAQTQMSLPRPLQGVASRLRPYLVPEMTHKSSRTRGLIPAFVASASGGIVNVGSGTRGVTARACSTLTSPAWTGST